MAAKKAESKAKAKEAFSWFWNNEEEEKKEKRDGQRQAVEREQETIVATLKDLPSWVRPESHMIVRSTSFCAT